VPSWADTKREVDARMNGVIKAAGIELESVRGRSKKASAEGLR